MFKYKIKEITTSSILLGLLLQSCAPLLPKNVDIDRKLEMPENYTGDRSEAEAAKDEEGKSEPESRLWQDYFKDPALVDLVTTALKHNRELNIINQEVSIAKNEVRAKKGEYLPTIGFGAGYEAERVGKYTSQGVSDSLHEYEPGKEVPEVLHNHRIALIASWELDIWKKLRNAKKSAYLKYLSSLEGKRFAVTQLVSEVALSYYELMSLDKQLEIVKSYVKVLEDAKRLVDLQMRAAKVTSLAVKRFEAEVLKNRAKRYDLEKRIVQAENNLNFLLGRFPQPIERNSHEFTEIIPSPIKTGVSSELLENRADVKKAELELAAAKLDVKSARARFYPALSIEARGGYEGFNVKHLLDPESIFYNLGANLFAPLINRSAIKADYLSANNKQIQALYDYEQTVIKAYSEVVGQLAATENNSKIYALKTEQVKAMKKSAEISTKLFKAARVDYVEALMTQRDFLETQVEQVEAKKDQLVSYINLYKSLGGGWDNKL